MRSTVIVAFAAMLVAPCVVRAQANPPKQTITIEEAERISVEKTGPGVIKVSMTKLEEVQSLIDIREDFTELTVSEAEGL